MNKHKFNIFPEAKPDDYARLIDDIRQNGFDTKQPVTIYQGEVLDGWNRQRACDELGINPSYTTFSGTDTDAIAFVMRTNKRRNLNSGQWACIAAEADDLLAVIREKVEEERRRKIAEAMENNTNRTAQSVPDRTAQKIAPSETKTEKETATKAAELFNTNRTYVNQAVKMKEKAPEVFEKVKAGKMTMQDATKAVRAIPTDPWQDDETERRKQAEKGIAVIANAQRDKNLIQWAEKQGLAVRVDRGSAFGNPFILPDDGDRDDVCDAYRDHYLPHKPSIQRGIHQLRGKVLICHCYPQRCHGDTLAEIANNSLT
jgi:hypothetical protein